MFSRGINFNFRDDFVINAAPFRRQLSCNSVSFMEGKDRPEVENGGKIILPPSALDDLARRNIQFPMLFKLTNSAKNKTTHCGVLEFVADEGKAYLPYWMMTNLLLEEGSTVQVENVSLRVAEYVKIQPQSVDFLDISNPKAVLEKALRSFACLTVNDIIVINYNKKRYELCVLELKPDNAVSIIECDMNVEFAAPVGYVEPEVVRPKQSLQHEDDDDDAIDYEGMRNAQNQFKVFGCQGVRLDGKKKDSSKAAASTGEDEAGAQQRGVPNYNYKKGKITFIRNGRPKKVDAEGETSHFSAFQGEGNKLRLKKR